MAPVRVPRVVTSQSTRRHHLPGGRFAVARLRDLPRAAAVVVVLLGILPPLLNIVARFGTRPMLHRLERFWARLAVRLLGIDLHISGLEHIDPDLTYVVTPLHEGFADGPALLHLPLDLRFVARGELAEWKVLGTYLRASDQIIVDPESPVAGYRRLLRAAPNVFAEHESLVVFPQGTILGIESAFSDGAFRLAEKSGRPVLPVALAGAHRVWEHPFSPLVRFGMPIRMVVLPPIEPEVAALAIPELQARMKRIALEGDPSARRFVPERDGWWDGYRYEIDPEFPELAARVARHRDSRDMQVDVEGTPGSAPVNRDLLDPRRSSRGGRSA